jgi:hypothetical protein
MIKLKVECHHIIILKKTRLSDNFASSQRTVVVLQVNPLV